MRRQLPVASCQLSVASRITKTFIVFFISASLYALNLEAQSLPVGTTGYEDYYRRQQLAGNLDSTVSFTIRPLFPEAIDSSHAIVAGQGFRGSEKLSSTSGQLMFSILPLSFQQRYYTLPSYNRNDGPMVPSKGYQAVISPGVFAKYGPLSIQLRPEFTFAANEDFAGRSTTLGAADLPFRPGDKLYSQLSWGQSSIRVTFDPVSIGLSNENLWWGPGMQNSLLMSNSASGFKHLTLNTTKPVRTPIGSFEAQLVAGRLEESGYTPFLPEDWRYLSGLVFTYQPRWVPGLFVGLSRGFQTYHQDMGSGITDWFPLFQAFQKANTTNTDLKREDQLVSFFARWMLKEAKAEVYFEFGKNDHSYDVRDFLQAPEHSRAYTLGFSKLVSINSIEDTWYQFGGEITRMEQSLDRLVRPAGDWYTHSQLLQGYTNKGQVLGAGIGPGGNLQSLRLSRVKGIDRIGIQLERLENNGDLASALGYRQWIDISIGAFADHTYKDFIFSGKLQGIQSYNYLWQDGMDGRDKKNAFNVNLDLGVLYRF